MRYMALIEERGLFSQMYIYLFYSQLSPFCQSFGRRERHSFPAPSVKWRRRYKSRGYCYESAKAIQYPHLGIKIIEES